MLRVGGRFRRNAYSSITPISTDVGDILDKKWRAWVEQESFKRYEITHTSPHNSSIVRLLVALGFLGPFMLTLAGKIDLPYANPLRAGIIHGLHSRPAAVSI